MNSGAFLLLSGNPARPFSPADLAGLALWLDPAYGLFQERTGAAATTPAVDDGDPVGTWRARTGQYFVAPSDAARPTLQVAEQNNQSALLFDGVDDYLQLDDVVVSDLTWTIACVARFVVHTPDAILFAQRDPIDLIPILAQFGTTGTGKLTADYRNDAGDLTRATAADAEALTWGQYSAYQNNGAVLQTRRDGEDVIGVAVTNPGATTVTISKVGEVANALVGEMLVYDAVLTSPDRAQAEGYLQARWGTP